MRKHVSLSHMHICSIASAEINEEDSFKEGKNWLFQRGVLMRHMMALIVLFHFFGAQYSNSLRAAGFNHMCMLLLILLAC